MIIEEEETHSERYNQSFTYRILSGRPRCQICGAYPQTWPRAIKIEPFYYPDVVMIADSATNSELWWITQGLGFACSQTCFEIDKEFPIPW